MSETLYERVGGQQFFDQLVDNFYDGVAHDEILRPMYPEDLSEAKSHLALFLAQYWGGPSAYGELRGHPRLRQRHAPFAVTKKARDAWLSCMTAAVDAAGTQLSASDRTELLDYFTMAATQLRNV